MKRVGSCVKMIFDKKDNLATVPSSWHQAPETLGFLQDEGDEGDLLFTANPFAPRLS